MAELADARDLKSLDRKVVRVQSPLWAPKQNERVTIQIHTRLPFKISPFTLVVAIANANSINAEDAMKEYLRLMGWDKMKEGD